jgi:anthranilate synthase component 1
VRHIETKLAGRAPPAGSGLADVPDILLLLTEELAVVDNLAGKISLIVYADPREPERVREGARAFAGAARKLREPVSIPFQTATQVTQARANSAATVTRQPCAVRRNTSRRAT